MSRQIVVLSFQSSSGSPLSNGTALLQLQQDTSAASAGGPQICAGRTVSVALDETGTGVIEIYLYPATVIFVTAYSAVGQPVWRGYITPTVASYILLEDGTLIWLESGSPDAILTEVQ